MTAAFDVRPVRYIGIGHYSRVGKDTLANLTMRKIEAIEPNLVVKKIPFAWKLKQICHELYSWAGMREPEFYDTPEGEPARDVVLEALGMTPVQVWVKVGTPAIRDQVYDRTWIDFVLKTDHGADIVFIPDVRFMNEVEAIREQKGTLIKVVRPGFAPRRTLADQPLLSFRGWDNVIGETGDMEQLDYWAERYALWLCERSSEPARLPEEIAHAYEVEAKTIWEANAIADAEARTVAVAA